MVVAYHGALRAEVPWWWLAMAPRGPKCHHVLRCHGGGLPWRLAGRGAMVVACQGASRAEVPWWDNTTEAKKSKNLVVSGGLVRARPPLTLLASGCESAARVLFFN